MRVYRGWCTFAREVYSQKLVKGLTRWSWAFHGVITDNANVNSSEEIVQDRRRDNEVFSKWCIEEDAFLSIWELEHIFFWVWSIIPLTWRPIKKIKTDSRIVSRLVRVLINQTKHNGRGNASNLKRLDLMKFLVCLIDKKFWAHKVDTHNHRSITEKGALWYD